MLVSSVESKQGQPGVNLGSGVNLHSPAVNTTPITLPGDFTHSLSDSEVSARAAGGSRTGTHSIFFTLNC